MKTLERICTLNDFDIDDIQSVYSGIDGKCCCGCSGKHYYASAQAHRGNDIRGYAIDADEVSDRAIRRVWNILRAHADEVEWTNIGIGKHLSVVVGRRLYIAYIN